MSLKLFALVSSEGLKYRITGNRVIQLNNTRLTGRRGKNADYTSGNTNVCTNGDNTGNGQSSVSNADCARSYSDICTDLNHTLLSAGGILDTGDGEGLAGSEYDRTGHCAASLGQSSISKVECCLHSIGCGCFSNRSAAGSIVQLNNTNLTGRRGKNADYASGNLNVCANLNHTLLRSGSILKAGDGECLTSSEYDCASHRAASLGQHGVGKVSNQFHRVGSCRQGCRSADDCVVELNSASSGCRGSVDTDDGSARSCVIDNDRGSASYGGNCT